VQVAPQNPQGTDHEKTMVVLVDEARRYTMAYGGGIEFQRLESRDNPAEQELRASPRGLFEISKANVFGRAHTVSFKARASTLQGRALATYSAPKFFARPDLTFLAAALYDRTRDVSTFTADRYEASTQVAWQRSPISSFLFRYSFRRVVVDAGSLRIDPNEVPLASQPTRISGPGFTWIRDRRDRPADATRGNFNTFDASIAVKPLGSSASFLRFFLQNSSFHPIGRSLIFARSARLGVQEPLSDTIADEIPLPERYFAGGAYSLRGFGLNQGGPRDLVTGFPVGGLALLAFNQELRFPIRLPWTGDKLGGAFFYDAGNVFTDVRHITLRPEPRDPARCLPSNASTVTTLNCHELNYFAHAVGIGLRYATPVGPVRLDLGYLLNPARFVTDDGMGNLTRERLPRFQFFLSIGSLF
jgi:outer membrane protein assembly factor BamA